ncbi:transcriptional regulator [Polynucleobacter sp. SHI8]|jgi:DNA-binding transcriptional MerR regulator|uniref:MerR family transcriptional regulator n=1 Tax=unclassified Polynucleobacter TaxID=2640945 RepID=UPI0024936B27|nr:MULTISPECIES: MerR family transcriptional regulator [unclassified Polynucleobacter]BDW11484.1 transcriptional regulator [Polynucleobacter sp. SHI2]BDW13931.1 transcriptional regulator [Polynucleobacter sp. SHI8]
MNLPTELSLSDIKETQKVTLPPIPAKRYFTIGEVGDLCAVKPHVLRYWEQEFNQLKPQKRRGNRRYYQHHEVVLIRRIRDLLYNDGFTIHGAKNRLEELDSQGQIRTELEAVFNILGDLRKLVDHSKSVN